MKKGVDYIGVAVGALIFNDAGEILLVKRSQQSQNERGCWEAPGGAVEFNEKLSDAIKREIKEELGVDVAIIKQYPAADHILTAEQQHWVPTTFLVSIVAGKQPTIMEPNKFDDIGWFALSELPTPLSQITKTDLKVYIKERSV